MSLVMCKECLSVYKSEYLNSNTCPKPDCEDELFEIDEEMIPIIRELRSKGYDTLYCCQGHLTSTINQVYVMIDKNPCENNFEDLNGNKLVDPPEGFSINKTTTLIYNESRNDYELEEATLIENTNLDKNSDDDYDYDLDMKYLSNCRLNLLKWCKNLKNLY